MNPTTLDAPELLHLAFEAAGRNAHGQAIEYLKQALDQPLPAADYVRVAFFLGSEYAQIGLIERAVEQMKQAIDVEPKFHIARFQLGLLHLTSGRPQEASETWTALEQIAEGETDYPLVLFKRGFEALARDEFDVCRDLLNQGIAANRTNLPLNGDMNKVLQAIAERSLTAPTETASSSKDGHLFISAYKNEPRR